MTNTINFKSFMCKAKLLENTGADGTNGTIRNALISVTLKYLSNIWRSLKMSLINCRVKLKLKCTKYFVLFTIGTDNINNRDYVIFTIEDTRLYVFVVTLSARANQKLSKLLSKEFKRSVYWNEYKIKVNIKQQINLNIF